VISDDDNFPRLRSLEKAPLNLEVRPSNMIGKS